MVIAKIRSNDPLKNRSLKNGVGVQYTTVLSVPAATIVNAYERYEAQSDGEFGLDSRRGDVWWRVEDIIINGRTYSGFMASRHKSQDLMTVEMLVPPPAEPAFPIPPFDLQVSWDGENFSVSVNGKEYAAKSS